MLRSASPNISVITNFGCRANCWYCIWKGHELEKVNQPTDWEKLTRFLKDNKDKGKVSVSGGGDSLYRYDKYHGWWEKFFDVASGLKMRVDVHTREKITDKTFWWRIHRCAFSSDYLVNDKEYLRELSKYTRVRITHLVTHLTTRELIEQYLDFQKEIDCQFTIKQLVGHDDSGMFEEIRRLYPDIYALPVGDYNIYYMPDNSIRESFL